MTQCHHGRDRIRCPQCAAAIERSWAYHRNWARVLDDYVPARQAYREVMEVMDVDSREADALLQDVSQMFLEANPDCKWNAGQVAAHILMRGSKWL